MIRFSEWADHRLGDYLVWATAIMAALAICATAWMTGKQQ